MEQYANVIMLANSRKNSGRCLAGKEVANLRWIRPVSRTKTGELCSRQYTYANGQECSPLDIVKIQLADSCPEVYQPENFRFAEGQWSKVGTYPFSNLPAIVDRPSDIWLYTGDRSDRVSIENLEKNPPQSSLLLIEPEAVTLQIRKGKPRAKFRYNNCEYNLVVTDPRIRYLGTQMRDGESIIKPVYLCLSLATPFNGYYYKLVASVITPGTEQYKERPMMAGYVDEFSPGEFDSDYEDWDSYTQEENAAILSELMSDETYTEYFGDDDYADIVQEEVEGIHYDHYNFDDDGDEEDY